MSFLRPIFCRFIDLLSRRYQLTIFLTRTYDILSRYNNLASHTYDLLSRRYDLVNILAAINFHTYIHIHYCKLVLIPGFRGATWMRVIDSTWMRHQSIAGKPPAYADIHFQLGGLR